MGANLRLPIKNLFCKFSKTRSSVLPFLPWAKIFTVRRFWGLWRIELDFCLLVPFQVCTHITKCYTVASQFEECREKITEMPEIIKDLCRVLYHKVCEWCCYSLCNAGFISLVKGQIYFGISLRSWTSVQCHLNLSPFPSDALSWSLTSINPLIPNIHIQILQTDLYIFS